MPTATQPGSVAGRQQGSLPYVLPFALFLGVLGLFDRLSLTPLVSGPLWFLVFVPVCLFFWPRVLSPLPRHWIASTAVGTAVFFLWIAPDLLIRGYRNLPLFSNSFLGYVHSSIPAGALRSGWVLAWRSARAILIVPVVEELFWRAWLMRWLINSDFDRVSVGTYAPVAFWVTAVMFAGEHGPYWDVGLLTGIVYNLWMIRTKSLADCVVMHAVTNGLLSAYVVATGQWQYWQ